MTSLLKPILVMSILPFLITYLLASSRSKLAISRKLFYLGTLMQFIFVAYAFYFQVPLAFSWAYVSQALALYLLNFNLYLMFIKKQDFEPLYRF